MCDGANDVGPKEQKWFTPELAFSGSLVSSSSDETLEASPSDDHDDDVNSSIQTTGPVLLRLIWFFGIYYMLSIFGIC